VSVRQNFDSLLFPADHPGRSKSDTYYINKSTVLRTHTSAHQADVFNANASDGFLISADVYRRDAVDRSHYPVFHQMEGARTWSSKGLSGSALSQKIWADFESLPDPGLEVEDLTETFDPKTNPLQELHKDQKEAIEGAAAHLKRSLELVVATIFKHMTPTSMSSAGIPNDGPLRVRWVPAYFPFTSPSWELEVWWNNDWLECLGSGIIRQELLNNAGVSDRFGWAFGLGIDRFAMMLFQIPDIRLFWSMDDRFLSQFKEPNVNIFKPFSKHPACPKDVSFWLPQTVAGVDEFHENDFMELIREVCGNGVEDVQLLDEFTHPKTGRKSKAYRVNYRSLEKTLTNVEVNDIHEKLRQNMVSKLRVELR
jgi:phenylalanyl-tRNA synthetase alpha chain